MDNTHEWCATGVSSEIMGLQGLSMDGFQWSLNQVQQGEVLSIPSVSTLPSAAVNERIMMERQCIKSLIIVPVFVGIEVGGCVGFDNVNAAEPWTEMDLVLLRVAAELIGNALLQKRAELALRASEENFRSFMCSAVGFAVYRLSLPPEDFLDPRVEFASSFVRDIPEDKKDMEITAAVIAMAHKLELAVVAEGVETEQQLEFLRKNACDLAQGFLFSRAVPAQQLAASLDRITQLAAS